MTKADEPAFPSVYRNIGHNVREMITDGGLTKREYFAGMAMQGMLANNDGVNRVWKAAKELNPHDLQGAATREVERHLAEKSVECADALLAELEKSNG